MSNVLDVSCESLDALNTLCRTVKDLDIAERAKLDAVVLMATPTDASELCHLAESLDQFDFIPGLQEGGGQFNECGYVAYHGTMTLGELMREGTTEPCQWEQGLQMGGLT